MNRSGKRRVKNAESENIQMHILIYTYIYIHTKYIGYCIVKLDSGSEFGNVVLC